jgi:UDP-N-acetylmuramoyl-L-alanyl-D-glutamate--2,6-diaminopimelate ligase
MTLGELATVLQTREVLPAAWREREISEIVHDSRKAVPGSLFVAVRGFHSDGHRFIPQAVRQGAVAVVGEEEGTAVPGAAAIMLPVPDSRKALAALAAKFFGYPSRRLALVGITGTNGKTTTSYLVKSVIEAAGSAAGLIGTIDYRIGSMVYPAPNTTPESLDLQRLFAEMAGQGIGHCVMEVSSHALALGRTDGCEFRVAAFTNLTQDHLDFHRTMEEYFQAKLLLFSGLGPGSTAVVNADDVRAPEIIRRTRARVITFGTTAPADVRPAGAVMHGMHGLSFTVITPRGTIELSSPLVGRHNVSNILAAVGIAVALGITGETIAAGVRSMRAVPGRMEKVDEGQPFGVIVDYAHTEDALHRLLDAVREVAAGRMITVFGCGGDRDRTKRPKMGAVAARMSDMVIVTSDNPRTEDPHAIIAEIEAGMSAAGRRAALTDDLGSPGARTPYLVLPDRATAIERAIGLAERGDVVVLAGKGHEDYQILGERKVPFDDREHARRAIRGRYAAHGDRTKAG